jgi:hypothetical protein
MAAAGALFSNCLSYQNSESRPRSLASYFALPLPKTLFAISSSPRCFFHSLNLRFCSACIQAGL